MLLLRQAFYVVGRLDDMQAQLGVSRKLLAERLARMVFAGLLALARATAADNSAPATGTG